MNYLMDLSRVIKRYERELMTRINSPGHYTNGKWVQEAVEKTFRGTFLPLSPNDLQITEAGTYTTQDKKLFVLSGLKDAEGNNLQFATGDIIVDGGEEFEIKEILAAPEVANYAKLLTKKKVVE